MFEIWFQYFLLVISVHTSITGELVFFCLKKAEFRLWSELVFFCLKKLEFRSWIVSLVDPFNQYIYIDMSYEMYEECEGYEPNEVCEVYKDHECDEVHEA